MARLVIGVEAVGADQVEKLAKSLVKADTALSGWLNTSSKAGTENLTAQAHALSAAFKKLSDQAVMSQAKLSVFLKGPNASMTASVLGQVKAVETLTGLHSRLVNAYAKEAAASWEGAAAIEAKTAAIEANVAAYAKLKKVSSVGLYDDTKSYVQDLAEFDASVAAQERGLKALEAQFAALRAARAGLKSGDYQAQILSENASIEAQERGLKALEAQFTALREVRSGLKSGDYQAQILSENASIEAQERGLKALEAQISRVNKARAALLAGSKAVSEYAQLGRDRLAAGNSAGGYDYYEQLKGEADLYDKNTGKLKENVNSLKSVASAYTQTTASAKNFHGVVRGISGAFGGLWLTYGNVIPMIAGFATVSASLKTVTEGTKFDYAARSIEILSYGYDTLSKNAEAAKQSLDGTRAALLAIKDSPFSAVDLAEGVLEFVRAGDAYKDLSKNIQYVDDASKFAYIGQMDLAKAIELVVGQVSAFKGTDPSTAYNAMAVVADKTSIDLQQMTEAFKNATSLGTVMKLQFTDVAVALGVMGQAGIRGATAGAALNTMMYKLAAPTETAKRKMAALGVEFSAFNATTGQMKSIKQIAFDLAGLTKALNAQQVSEVFESMVGLRGVKALGALVQMAKEGADQFNSLSKAVEDSGDYLDGYFKLLEQSGKTQLDLLKAEFSNLFSASYVKSEPAVVKAIKALRDVVSNPELSDSLSFVVNALSDVVVAAASGAGAVIDFVGALNNIVPVGPTVESILAGIANKFEQVAKLAKIYREGSAGAVFSAPEDMWAYSDFNDTSVEETRKKIEGLADTVKEAKRTLTDFGGVKIPVYSVEDGERVGKVAEYFDSILIKIQELNKSPIELVNDKIENDIANMFGQLTQGGLTLTQMLQVTDKYVAELDSMGRSGEIAADKIDAIAKSLDKMKGDEKTVAQVKANLSALATALNKAEMEKANKQVLSSMRKDWQDYAKRVIDIQDSLAKNQRSLAAELRAIDQSGMTGIQLWRDKKKEMEEYKSLAVKVAKEAETAYSIGDAVKGDSKAAQAKDYFDQAVAAAKALNTEVKGNTTAMDSLVARQQDYITQLETAKTIKELSGKSTVGEDAALVKARNVLSVYEAQQKAASATLLITRQQGAAAAKEGLTSIYAEQENALKKLQAAQKVAMDKIQADAQKASGSIKPIDMTKGMDAAMAKYITAWRSTQEDVQKSVAETAKVALAYLAEVDMPTENWKNSIFGMRNTFVRAVDEMAAKLDSEFDSSKVTLKFTNLIGGSPDDQAYKLFDGIKIKADETASGMYNVWTDTWGKWVQTGSSSVNQLVTWLNKVTVIQSDILKRGLNVESAENLNAMQGAVETILANIEKDYLKSTAKNKATSDEFLQGYIGKWSETEKVALQAIDNIFGDLTKFTSKKWSIDLSINGKTDIESRSAGGLIGYNLGGLIQKLATGGTVRNVLQGAYLPGYGGGDRRLLLGEDGEVMLNKRSVSRGGVDTALAFNREDYGTVVNNLVSRSLAYAPATSSDMQTIVWQFSDTGESAVVHTTAADLSVIERGIKRKQRLRS